MCHGWSYWRGLSACGEKRYVPAECADQHGNLPGDDDAQRAEFKDMIKSWRRKADEENFDEALKQSYQAFVKSEVSEPLAELM